MAEHPSYKVLEELDHGRQLVELLEGDLAGTTVVLVALPTPGLRPLDELLADPCGLEHPFWLDPRPARPTTRAPRRRGQAPSPSAERRARELLLALLDEDQRESFSNHGRFSVPTPYGTVELGELFNLGFTTTLGERFSLCVVPTSAAELPICDVWVNLLLVLRAEPKRFMEVANWRHLASGQCGEGPVPGLGLSPRRRR